MHISKEFLAEAVSLSLLVTLILVSMQLFHRSMKITELMEEKQTRQIAELEEYEIVKYEDLLVDGMTVINYIKRMNGTYGLPIYVSADTGDFTIIGKSEYAELRNIESGKYINPLKKYRCKVERDENGVINKIRIEKGD